VVEKEDFDWSLWQLEEFSEYGFPLNPPEVLRDV
jgi:hypothetical protein